MAKSLSEQITQRIRKDKEQVEKEISQIEQGEGDFTNVISTGSTLLDLAISGGRIYGGGLPAGILVEISGVESSGKTALLCEIAGNIQRKGGQVLYHDPEARLNHQFAQMFGLQPDPESYIQTDTVTEVFQSIRKWQPARTDVINGIITDSLAALSTEMELEKEEGDKMGMKRAKEFSEQLRKTCRILTQKNYLMCCSNQIRENTDAGLYGQKYVAPGGKAIGFYSSLRLRTSIQKKLTKTKLIYGKEVKRIIGIEIEVEVFKSSVWKPYHSAPLTIIFDYGIDDIRQNLQFIKTYTGKNVYTINNESLGISLENAIQKIEENNQALQLRQEVISLWNEIESQFDSDRKLKLR